jgi:hypothetical protein
VTWPGNLFTHKGVKLQKNRTQLQSVGYSQETPPLLCHRPSTRPLLSKPSLLPFSEVVLAGTGMR